MEKWRGTYLITFLLLDVSRGGADQLKNNKIKQESDIWKISNGTMCLIDKD